MTDIEALVITVQMDSLNEYAWRDRVRLSVQDPHLFYRQAFERLTKLVQRLDVPVTLFCPARDLCYPISDALKDVIAQGWEVGTSGYEPKPSYGLQDRGPIAKDLKRTKIAFKEELGIEPLGFRCSDGSVSKVFKEELISQNYSYDSSVVPRWGTALRSAWRSRRRVLPTYTAPNSPYRIGDEPWEAVAEGQSSKLIEIPITALKTSRRYQDRPWTWSRTRSDQLLNTHRVWVIRLEIMDFGWLEDARQLRAFARRWPWLWQSPESRLELLYNNLKPMTDRRATMTAEALSRHF